ncbi:MAG: OmpH family outer membrane protein [Pseudomonadota bacterium]
MAGRVGRRLFCTGLAAWGGAAVAQDLPEGVPQSGVLTVDSQRLFAGSAFGRRVARQIEERSAALAQENRRIANELSAEERELTELRATLPAEEFRALADAYDTKVQETRRAQNAKSDELDSFAAQQQRAFLAAAAPVLEALMREAGAVIVLEKERVLLSATAIEVTDIAIARIDAAIGEGD